MTPELQAALDRARLHVMTPEETFEQRVSFVYGGMSNDGTLTKDDIRAMLAKAQGTPPAPEGYVLVPREPTEAMLIAARDWSHHKYGKPIGNDAAQGCWAAMLTTARRTTP